MTETWFRFQELKPKNCYSQTLSQWLVLENFGKKVFETNLNDKYQQEKRSEKLKIPLIYQLLKSTYVCALFFSDFYLLVPKIEVCLRHFLDKNFKNQP